MIRILIKIAESIKEANERLNFYSMYENTMDKNAIDAERELKRKHPVQYAENHLDYNSMFDEQQLKVDNASTPKSTLMVSFWSVHH